MDHRRDGRSVVRALLWQHARGLVWSSWALAATACLVSTRAKISSPPAWLDLAILGLAAACGYLLGLWISLDETDRP